MTEHAINEFLDFCGRVKEKVEYYNSIINKTQTRGVSKQVQAAKNWVAENQNFLYRSKADAGDLYQKATKEGEQRGIFTSCRNTLS